MQSRYVVSILVRVSEEYCMLQCVIHADAQAEQLPPVETVTSQATEVPEVSCPSTSIWFANGLVVNATKKSQPYYTAKTTQLK